jgi:hypothetical protein
MDMIGSSPIDELIHCIVAHGNRAAGCAVRVMQHIRLEKQLEAVTDLT